MGRGNPQFYLVESTVPIGCSDIAEKQKKYYCKWLSLYPMMFLVEEGPFLDQKLSL